MKEIYWEIGEELRYSLEENGFDISKAIEVGSTNNSTIFNTTDNDGIIISQDYVSYNKELYNERISSKVKIYHGGLGVRYPRIDIFCRDTKMNDTDISISNDNYFVMHNFSNKNAYEKLASKKMVVFLDYKEVRNGKDISYKEDNLLFGYRDYTHITKYVVKNKKIYCLSIMIPHSRIKKEMTGRTK